MKSYIISIFSILLLSSCSEKLYNRYSVDAVNHEFIKELTRKVDSNKFSQTSQHVDTSFLYKISLETEYVPINYVGRETVINSDLRSNQDVLYSIDRDFYYGFLNFTPDSSQCFYTFCKFKFDSETGSSNLVRIGPTYMGLYFRNTNTIDFKTEITKLVLKKPKNTKGNIFDDIKKVKTSPINLRFVIGEFPDGQTLYKYGSFAVTDIILGSKNKLGGNNPIFYQVNKDNIFGKKDFLTFKRQYE
jgi:hypothetical protein